MQRGLQQLRYAMPHVVTRLLSVQEFVSSDDTGLTGMCCAILVTTAPLWVLRNGCSIEEFRDAKEISGIADSVPWLVVTEEDSPSRARYANEVYEELVDNNQDLVEQVQNLGHIFPKEYLWKPLSGSALGQIENAIVQSGDHIAIVTLEHLPAFMKDFEQVARRVSETEVRFATLSNGGRGRAIVGPPTKGDLDRIASIVAADRVRKEAQAS